MNIRILGSGSATPFLGRYQSSILVEHHHQLYLLDCGEGMQMQMLRYEVKFSKLNHIFISHLHGDHYLGLIGLLSSLHSWGRTNDLYLFGPPGLKEILTIQFKYQETSLNYKIVFHAIEKDKKYTIVDNKDITISTIPLKHRLQTSGFLFNEKRGLQNIIKSALPENVLLQHIHLLKSGEDVLNEDGSILYRNVDYTLPIEKVHTFAYCTDTIFDEELIEIVKDADLLYHEATFLEEKAERAKLTFHSTARQAATIALKANVKQLVIGHYSARYKDISPFLKEAQEVFQNTYLSEEGKVFSLN